MSTGTDHSKSKTIRKEDSFIHGDLGALFLSALPDSHLGFQRRSCMMRDNSVPEFTGLFAGRWWAVLLRGLVAIAFGVLAFTWPGITLATLVMLFGFYALLDGAFSLITAIGGRRRRDDRWLLILEGVVGI